MSSSSNAYCDNNGCTTTTNGAEEGGGGDEAEGETEAEAEDGKVQKSDISRSLIATSRTTNPPCPRSPGRSNLKKCSSRFGTNGDAKKKKNRSVHFDKRRPQTLELEVTASSARASESQYTATTPPSPARVLIDEYCP